MTTYSDNLFLASLDPADMTELASHLRRVRLDLGDVIVEQGDEIDRAVLPIDAQLANILQLSDGGMVEVAIVGREGLAGLAPIMSGRPCGWRISVRAAGAAYVGPASVVRALQRGSAAFMGRLLDLTQFYQEQAAQTGACNAHHRLQAQLAKWILTAADLAPSGSLRFTHEELASLLGCQRTSVTAAAQALEAAGAVEYSRGRITVVSRKRLEAHACECYQALRVRAAIVGVETG